MAPDEIICFLQLDSEKHNSKRYHLGHPLAVVDLMNPNFKPRFIIIRYMGFFYWINLKTGRIWHSWRTMSYTISGLWWRGSEIKDRNLSAKIFKRFKQLL